MDFIEIYTGVRSSEGRGSLRSLVARIGDARDFHSWRQGKTAPGEGGEGTLDLEDDLAKSTQQRFGDFSPERQMLKYDSMLYKYL